jgi:hypothetical protein
MNSKEDPVYDEVKYYKSCPIVMDR